jgi:hypothetical protein
MQVRRVQSAENIAEAIVDSGSGCEDISWTKWRGLHTRLGQPGRVMGALRLAERNQEMDRNQKVTSMVRQHIS